MAYRLLNSLYGLKQSSRRWNIKLIEALIGACFTQCNHDYSLFTMRKGEDVVIIFVYVDDLLITRSRNELVSVAKSILHDKFKIKYLGELKYFLSIEVLRSQQCILLNQRKYVLELISVMRLGGAKPSATPLETNYNLTTMEYDKVVGTTKDLPLQDVCANQRLLGKLLYMTITRPNTSYTVQTLSQFMQMPIQLHWEAAIRVVKYLKNAPGLGVFMKAEPTQHLTCWCNSD
uniref:Uncharacterized mitochondrial protein AtMg00810-like n=1 Tax=Nicotiana tabacum TaxID=4097 RepID=A0A1S3X4B6_TOBAC|nr:PREDICTED: uncharacterized mitochondrial protein AtMg00810-like [Nicotiana tabacum]